MKALVFGEIGQLGQELIRRAGDGWTFASPTLHGTLTDRLRAADDLADAHAACAAWLETQPASTARDRRMGLHLLSVSPSKRALDLLLQSTDISHADKTLDDASSGFVDLKADKFFTEPFRDSSSPSAPSTDDTER